MRKINKLIIFLILVTFVPFAYSGTISRFQGNFSTHDELANLDKLNHQLNDLFTWSSNVDYSNVTNEGLRNEDFDSDEVFSRETWTNLVTAGHFPAWSNGLATYPDKWCPEGTPTIAGECASTNAPGHMSFQPQFHSVKITATGAGLEGINQSFNVRKSTTYSVSLKVKCTSGDVARIAIDDDNSMDAIAYDYSDTIWQTENNKKYFTFRTAGDSNYITIKLMAKSSGDIVWFSEIQVTEGRLMKGYQYQSADADTIDGLHASSTITAGMLYPLNSSGDFPIEVLPDADAVDGLHATEVIDQAQLGLMIVEDTLSTAGSEQVWHEYVNAGGYAVKVTYEKIYIPDGVTTLTCWGRLLANGGGTAYVKFILGGGGDTGDNITSAGGYEWKNADLTVTSTGLQTLTISLRNDTHQCDLQGYVVFIKD